MMQTITRFVPATLGLFLTLSQPDAQAHEGHGMPGANHWHTGDIWLFLFLAALALCAWRALVWWRDRK